MFPTAHGVVSQAERAGDPGPSPDGLTLALIVADALHDTTTQTASELTGLGHSVTVVPEGSVSTTDFSGFDALVTCRVTASAGVGNAIRAVMNAGMPAVIGFVPVNPPSNNDVTTIAARTALSSSSSRVRSGQEEWLGVVDNTHPITSPYPLGQLTVTQERGYRSGLVPTFTVGQRLADSSVNTGGTTWGLVAIEAGTPDRSSNPLAARAALVDYIGSGAALAPAGLNLLDRTLRWAAGDL